VTLDADIDNVRAAFDWALREADAQSVIRAADALRSYCALRGRLGDDRWPTWLRARALLSR
jgi:hypothetical protein